jgi:hypothetical protein
MFRHYGRESQDIIFEGVPRLAVEEPFHLPKLHKVSRVASEIDANSIRRGRELK